MDGDTPEVALEFVWKRVRVLPNQINVKFQVGSLSELIV
jgi:hypothetical protein